MQITNIQSQNKIEKPTNTGAINISATSRTRRALQTITDGVDEFSILPALFLFLGKISQSYTMRYFYLFIWTYAVLYIPHTQNIVLSDNTACYIYTQSI